MQQTASQSVAAAAEAEALALVDGRFVPKGEASLSVEDRGTLFGDGVYEVVRFYGGEPFELGRHVARLRASLAGIELPEPGVVRRFEALSRELVRRNGLSDAKVYWQITRGAGGARDHAVPAGVSPSVVMLAYPAGALGASAVPGVVELEPRADERWACCWIKSLMLLPNVLARHRAKAAGFDDALLHRGGVVTEATAANALVVRGGALWTHPCDGSILAGVTRAVVLELAGELGLAVHERAVTLDELRGADEVMLTGTTVHVTAVRRIGEAVIGQGLPGPVTRRLHGALVERIRRSCGLAGD